MPSPRGLAVTAAAAPGPPNPRASERQIATAAASVPAPGPRERLRRGASKRERKKRSEVTRQLSLEAKPAVGSQAEGTERKDEGDDHGQERSESAGGELGEADDSSNEGSVLGAAGHPDDKLSRKDSSRRGPGQAAPEGRKVAFQDATGQLLFLPLGNAFIQTLRLTPRRPKTTDRETPHIRRGASHGPVVSTRLRGARSARQASVQAQAFGLSRNSSTAELGCYDAPAATAPRARPTSGNKRSPRPHASGYRRVQGGLVLGAGASLPGMMFAPT